MNALAFVDCETTHLDPRFGDAWEIAIIRREADQAAAGITTCDREHLWQVRVPLQTVSLDSLAIGRYAQRFAVPDGRNAVAMPLGDGDKPEPLTVTELAFAVHDALDGAVVAGSNPGFDVGFLAKLVRPHVDRIPWHYRPLDVPTLVAGHVQARGEQVPMPYSSRALSRSVGVEPPGEDGHQALVDARWIRDVYDAATLGCPRRVLGVRPA